MVKPVKFAHVVYQTRRYAEMIAWYETVFEATVVHRDPALAFLTYDDEHHRIAIANLDLLKPGGGGADDRGAIGVNHVAYTYASVADLFDTYLRLKKGGVTPYWPVHHGTTLSMYYRDPDGNRMEFQVDVGTVADAMAFMASDTFAANPVGVDYDPEALLARWRQGESEAQLLKRPDGPPAAIPVEHGMT
ncbi:VOC family protein [Caulobacter sp. KR2-114]|uniref:VOC family protein n=1 Tax=Caulobacter sp. KR2-114 TaxID=3400912 RepID=UPI003C0E1988